MKKLLYSTILMLSAGLSTLNATHNPAHAVSRQKLLTLINQPEFDIMALSILPPIHYATLKNDLHLVRVLTSQINCDVNDHAAALNGVPPLYMASQLGYTAVGVELIKAGADVNQLGNNHQSPLHIAAEVGYINIVNALIRAGARVNQTTRNGSTPLFYASQNGHIDIVNALVRAGALVNEARNDGATPIYMASQNNHIGVVTALIQAQADVNKPVANGTIPLVAASKNRHIDIVRTLLQHGANANHSIAGVSTLHIACIFGHPDIVELLIEYGADLNAGDPAYIWHCLAMSPPGTQQHGIDQDNIKVAQTLIKKGTKITIQDLKTLRQKGWFILIVAGMVEFLKQNPQELPKYQTVMQLIVDLIPQNQAWLNTETGRLCALLCQLLFPTINAPQQFIDVGNQELERIQSIREAFLQANIIDKYLTDLLLTEFLGIPNIKKLSKKRRRQ